MNELRKLLLDQIKETNFFKKKTSKVIALLAFEEIKSAANHLNKEKINGNKSISYFR